MEISIRAYARHRGVSHVKILRDLKAGLIPKTKSGKIDPAIADAAWEKNRDPSQGTKKRPGNAKAKAAAPEPAKPAAPEPEIKASLRNALKAHFSDEKTGMETSKLDEAVEAAFDAITGHSYAHARAEREYVHLSKDELALAKLQGELISVAEVDRRARDVANVVREGVLSIPDRVSSLCAAESDASRVHAIISGEVRKALIGISDQLSTVQ